MAGNELELHQISDTIAAFDQYPMVTDLGEGINATLLLLRPQS